MGVLLSATIAIGGCACATIYHNGRRNIAQPRLTRALNFTLSWPAPGGDESIEGARLIADGARVRASQLAIARAILRTNPRIVPAYALLFAGATVHAAHVNAVAPEFLAAAILQESAYDPQALSSAGAIGIAQFMPETAAGVGLNPYDPFASLAAAGALIGGYVAAYRQRYGDPYAVALAAYNAGPLAVARYHGVPPYDETRDYIALIFDRWARIVSYEDISLGAP